MEVKDLIDINYLKGTSYVEGDLFVNGNISLERVSSPGDSILSFSSKEDVVEDTLLVLKYNERTNTKDLCTTYIKVTDAEDGKNLEICDKGKESGITNLFNAKNYDLNLIIEDDNLYWEF